MYTMPPARQIGEFRCPLTRQSSTSTGCRGFETNLTIGHDGTVMIAPGEKAKVQ
jgi:hypothetical protein